MVQQRWVSAANLARYIGVHPDTVRDWIAGGVLPATRVQKCHYADGRPRKSDRGRWRIYEADIDAFLTRWMAGGRRLRRVPPSLWQTR